MMNYTSAHTHGRVEREQLHRETQRRSRRFAAVCFVELYRNVSPQLVLCISHYIVYLQSHPPFLS